MGLPCGDGHSLTDELLQFLGERYRKVEDGRSVMGCVGVSYLLAPQASTDAGDSDFCGGGCHLSLVPLLETAMGPWTATTVGLKRCRGLLRHLQRLWGSTEVHLCLQEVELEMSDVWLAAASNLNGS